MSDTNPKNLSKENTAPKDRTKSQLHPNPLVKEWIGLVSNGAGIVALGLGIWAFMNPQTVNDYLQEIGVASKQSVSNLKVINNSTANTSKNTKQIAKNVPQWIVFDKLYQSSNHETEPKQFRTLDVEIRNPTNFLIRDIKVTLVGREKQRTSLKEFALPPKEKYSTTEINRWNANFYISRLCITGYSVGSEKMVYEDREIKREKILESNGYETITTNWILSTISPSEHCSY